MDVDQIRIFGYPLTAKYPSVHGREGDSIPHPQAHRHTNLFYYYNYYSGSPTVIILLSL